MRQYRLCYFLFFSFAFISCTKEPGLIVDTNTYNTVEPPADDRVRLRDSTYTTYLALGDSYTFGSSVDTSERFPTQAANLLRKNFVNLRQPEYLAVPGWTTHDLLRALEAKGTNQQYDLVTLLVGVNDSYKVGKLQDYRETFTILIKKTIVLAGSNPAHVFVLSIPDYSATPFVVAKDKAAISKLIQDYNAINHEIATSFKCNYIDITGISRQASSDATLTASDGLHPSGSQYAMWVKPLNEKILKALR
jgi:lysophospholipase L1-like esterase